MLSKIKIAFGYWLMWILIFLLARLAFVLYNISETSIHSLNEILQSFIYGLKMDVSMASYLLLPVCIFLFLSIYVSFFQKQKVYRVYNTIILLPVLLIIFCDLPAYTAWGFRLDASPLKYLDSPKEAWASVSNLPLFWMLAAFTLSYCLLLRFLNRYFLMANTMLLEIKNKFIQFIFLLLFIATQLIPIRGGFQLIPLNQSSVYFSTKNYLNLAAINVTWNFMHSLTKKSNVKENPFAVFSKNEAITLTKKLFDSPDSIPLITELTETTTPNIILIIWESFTKKAVNNTWKGIPITPGFNQLINEGIYFSNVYATGERTDKGIVALLSGYPAQPTTSIIVSPQKAFKLPKLPGLLKNKGYSTSFYYGGELEFANMKAYLMNCGFDSFTSIEDFDSEDLNSKWGAHDGVVKNKILKDLPLQKAPYFTTWLTLSSHEPYETPTDVVINGSDNESKFLNSMHYADSCVFAFVAGCKKLPSWKNTVLVIVGDHGHRLPRTKNRIDNFTTPVLWLGGALKNKGIRINHVASQIDIATTILQQSGSKQNPFPWGKNLFSAVNHWAYLSFNNGFGFVENDGYFIYDNVGNNVFEKSGYISDTTINKGRALQQLTFTDYLEK